MSHRTPVRVLSRVGRFTGVTALIAGVMIVSVATPAAVASPSSAPVLRIHRVPAPAAALPLSDQAPRAVTSNVWTQRNEVTGTADTLYGYSVAVSGSTMVVGAPADNSGTGAVFVYAGSGTTWTQEAEVTPNDGTSGDFFGGSVAITPSGTSLTIVVGAESHSTPPLSNEGAAYVYTGSGSSWTKQAELIDPGQAGGDFFGSAVAASPNSVLVAASGENSNEGAVFVYANQRHGFVAKAELTDPGGVPNDSFGSGLAVNAKTMVVGAPGDHGFTGAAYVFKAVRGGWIVKDKLTASNGKGCVTTCSFGYGFVGGDYFGYSVALRGKTLAVGAPFASVPPANDGVGSGSAYVYTGSGSHWTQNAELFVPAEISAHTEDWFGYTTAVSANFSVVATAQYDPQGAFNAPNGAAFVFPKQGGSWPVAATPAKLTAGDGVPGDYFGYGVTTVGTNVVVVGSPYSPNGGLYFFEN